MAGAVHAVSPERHRNSRWRPLSNYDHAQNRHLVGIAASELSQATQSFALAFTEQNDAVALVAILGLSPNTSLFVASDGTWLGRYVPAMLRAHPFAIANGEGRQVLCIDETSGLAGPDDTNSRPFFDETGAIAKPTAEVVGFLEAVNGQLQRSSQLATLLRKHAVLEPWRINIRGADGENTKQVSGLLRVNETALNALGDAAYLELRGGALALAHAQLLSMPNLSLLPRVAEARQARERQIKQRRAEEAAMFQASGTNQDVIDWDRVFND